MMKKRILTLALVIFAVALLSNQISCSSLRIKNPVESEPNNAVQTQLKASFAQEIASFGKPVMVVYPAK
jgi:hypothetical protein